MFMTSLRFYYVNILFLIHFIHLQNALNIIEIIQYIKLIFDLILTCIQFLTIILQLNSHVK
jgi:hypothetical protein